MRSGSSRFFLIGLVALTAVLTVTSTAGGWSRPAGFAVSSSDGGVYRACRDGITFQVANNSAWTLRFVVTSPPGSTIVAQGMMTLKQIPLLTLPEGDSYTYLGTTTVRWADGRLLEPGPDSVEIGVYDPAPSDHVNRAQPDDIQDCYLFPPKTKGQCKKGGWRRWAFKNQGRCIAYVEAQAREACLAEREAGPAAFRTKYGTGKQHRNALRGCVRETT